MLSKNKIKYIQSLRLKKNRQKNHAFLVEGEKIVGELLQYPKWEIEQLIATSDWLAMVKLPTRIKRAQITETDARELKKISNLSTPNQVMAVAKIPPHAFDLKIIKKDLSLYLDGIQDPGNLGTIARIADWFGIQYVFCSEQTADLYSPKVIQATMGAFLRVQIMRLPFDELKTELPQLPIYGAVLNGANIFQTSLQSKGLLVIGNEGKGISEEILTQIDHKISIPAPHHSGAESLNAGVATGIICAAFRNL